MNKLKRILTLLLTIIMIIIPVSVMAYEEVTKDNVYLIDNIAYTDLIVGKEYIVKGVLMDKKTNKPFIQNEKEVTSTIKFKPKESNGNVEVKFVLSKKALKELDLDLDLVVFQEIYREEKLVAEHKDIDDVGQTVKLYPTDDPKRPPLPNTSAVININENPNYIRDIALTVMFFTGIIILILKAAKKIKIKEERNIDELKG